MSDELTIRVARKIGALGRSAWDRLVGDGSPFLKWDWLDCLEKTGCASEKTGWAPHHITVESRGNLIAACPMYLKSHSMGEFVFDHEWAAYAAHAGIRYYPKMLVGVPFTPVTGARFLTGAAENRPRLIQLLGQALIRVCEENKISSIHVNFCLEEERDLLAQIGFLPRAGIQFHWQNRGFRTFDDYLASFKSDRRNKIKRERRELSKQGITIRAVVGEELNPPLLKTMFRLYKHHVDQLYYGQQYLNQAFFEEACARFRPHLCLIVAERDGRIIAGTFNVQDPKTLYGRYWGCFEEHNFLHFNVCYYAAIEYCIATGRAKFEAGAGGGFKQLRGLDPEHTYSAHYVLDGRFRRALEQHLKEERAYTAIKREALLERSQLKKPAPA
ncbi:MAG TPA: GNAT family N-acetyltransferase [Candidatus Acidoferrales bacterium]|nr:GNAT family N-acetyltransferase [Candidatus Acidoferrales bacterium]